MSVQDIRPPNPPWSELEVSDNRAVLAIYLSDPNTNVPIRDVSNKNDPKADPNVETLTFGLFSYCHEQMRKSIVDNGIELLFFCTQRREMYLDGNREKYHARRVLTGYYKIGWYYEVDSGDFMLAARSGKFVFPGFPLDSLTTYLHGDRLNTGFYQWKYLHEKTPKLLFQLINDTPDDTKKYSLEIQRLEREALEEYGFMYLTRKEGFSWEDAPRPMKL